MELADFRLVVDVHLMGSATCTKAVWNAMRAQNYGRIVMTTSCSGLYGNFGQANYAAAKMGVIGLMQTLGIEGEKNNVRVNCLAPTGATRMMEGILPAHQLAQFARAGQPRGAGPVSENAPNRAILSAGAGGYELAYIALTCGIALGEAATAEQIRALGRTGRPRRCLSFPPPASTSPPRAAQGRIPAGSLKRAVGHVGPTCGGATRRRAWLRRRLAGRGYAPDTA